MARALALSAQSLHDRNLGRLRQVMKCKAGLETNLSHPEQSGSHPARADLRLPVGMHREDRH